MKLIVETDAISSAGSVGVGPVNTIGANLIVVTTQAGGVVSDSLGNVWTLLVTGTTVEMRYCFNPIVGPSHTFSVTGAGLPIAVQAFAGVANEFPTIMSDATGTQPGEVTPATNNSLVLTTAICNTSTAIPAGYIGLANTTGTSGQSIVGVAYKLLATPAPENPTWTNAFASAVVVFRGEPLYEWKVESIVNTDGSPQNGWPATQGHIDLQSAAPAVYKTNQTPTGKPCVRFSGVSPVYMNGPTTRIKHLFVVAAYRGLVPPDSSEPL